MMRIAVGEDDRGWPGRCTRPPAVTRTALPLLLWLWCAVAGATGAGDLDIAVDYRDGRYSASVRMLVPVRPATALAVLTDFDHMAEFVPNLTASRITARSGNVLRVVQEGKADFGPFSWRFSSERRVEIFPDGRVLARGLSGSIKSMQSELRLHPAEANATLIEYRIVSAPDFWVPASVGTSFLEHEMEEQFTAIAGEMRRREAKGGR
jgi:ribosome-associated toxin RatA of RatAB toxin-antitoxin module